MGVKWGVVGVGVGWGVVGCRGGVGVISSVGVEWGVVGVGWGEVDERDRVRLGVVKWGAYVGVGWVGNRDGLGLGWGRTRWGEVGRCAVRWCGVVV